MKSFARAGGVVCLLSIGFTASGWGPVGHRAVGLIAEKYLTRNTATKIRELMGRESLPEASTWADEIRSDPAWKKASPWHYVNIEDDETYDTAPKNPDGDVVQAMIRFEAVLRDQSASRKARVEALRFLVHFVGDIHQPLHAGRRSDRGGNEVKVMWFNTPTDLHTVWDSSLINDERLSFTELASFINDAKDSEIRDWQSSSYVDWVKESIELRGQAYDIGDGKLGYAYRFRALPIVKRRILQAGIRLAGLLNWIFME
jgi:hypothetical protein